MLLTILYWYAILSGLWACGLFSFYMLFVAVDDRNGDGGLAFFFLALLPWIWPWLLWTTIRDGK